MKASTLLSGGGGPALYEQCAATVLSFNLFSCLVAPLQLCSMEIWDLCWREIGVPVRRVTQRAEDCVIKEVHRHSGVVLLESPSGINAALDLLWIQTSSPKWKIRPRGEVSGWHFGLCLWTSGGRKSAKDRRGFNSLDDDLQLFYSVIYRLLLITEAGYKYWI